MRWGWVVPWRVAAPGDAACRAVARWGAGGCRSVAWAAERGARRSSSGALALGRRET